MSNHSTPPCLAFRQKISLEQQVQLHIFKEQVYGEGHSLARKDKKGWERVWFLMKGNNNYPKSNSKNYYHCRHFGINGKPGDQVHPFDKPLMHTRDSRVSKLSINLITSMLQLLAGRAENDLDIHVAYIPTSNSYNNGREQFDISSLDQNWKDLFYFINDIWRPDHYGIDSYTYILNHFKNEANFCLPGESTHYVSLLQAKRDERQLGHSITLLHDIFLEVGSAGVAVSRTKLFPHSEDIHADFHQWLVDNPGKYDAYAANIRLRKYQKQLVLMTTNNCNPSAEFIRQVDDEWLRTGGNRGYKEYMHELRYTKGEGVEYKHLFLMQLELHHHDEAAVAQKREDERVLGRGAPCKLSYIELGARSHHFTLLSATDHARETLGEEVWVPNKNCVDILYNALMELQMAELGEECEISGVVLPYHLVDTHHGSEQMKIKEGNVVHPTAKLYVRHDLYNTSSVYGEWSVKVFSELIKLAKLKKEWHKYLHWAIRNIDWLRKQGFDDIEYPYKECRRSLVRTSTITSTERAASEAIIIASSSLVAASSKGGKKQTKKKAVAKKTAFPKSTSGNTGTGTPESIDARLQKGSEAVEARLREQREDARKQKVEDDKLKKWRKLHEDDHGLWDDVDEGGGEKRKINLQSAEASDNKAKRARYDSGDTSLGGNEAMGEEGSGHAEVGDSLSTMWTLKLLPMTKEEALVNLKEKLPHEHQPFMKTMNRKFIAFAKDKYNVPRHTITFSNSANVVLGRNITGGWNAVSRKLCDITLTSKSFGSGVHASIAAEVTIRITSTNPDQALCLNGRFMNKNDLKVAVGAETVLRHGDIISLCGPTGFAYRVELSMS